MVAKKPRSKKKNDADGIEEIRAIGACLQALLAETEDILTRIIKMLNSIKKEMR